MLIIALLNIFISLSGIEKNESGVSKVSNYELVDSMILSWQQINIIVIQNLHYQ